MSETENIDTVLQAVQTAKVTNAAEISADQVVYDASFRKMCEQNSCGRYGRFYVCPPNVGEIDDLIARAKAYPKAVLYQSVFQIEDSFDFEGMVEASRLNHEYAQQIQDALLGMDIPFLHLTSGGCDLCEKCGIVDHIPCRHPDRALSNMESYGIYVAKTAENAGMKYINGSNTVTYFGIVFFGA